MISDRRRHPRGRRARERTRTRRPPVAGAVSVRTRRRRRRAPLAPRVRLAGLALAFALAAAIAVGTLRGDGSRPDAAAFAQPNPAELAPDGRPERQLLASAGVLRLWVPVRQTRVTAVVYHGVGDEDVLPLEAAGRQQNAGFFTRLADDLFGDGATGGPGYYVDDSAPGADTGSVDVGAPAGTSVWAPVDGTVVSVRPYVLNGRSWGTVLQVRPVEAPATLVTLTHLAKARRIAVGSTIVAGRTRLGSVRDLAAAVDQTVARFSADAGNHVHMEVSPAPAASPLLN